MACTKDYTNSELMAVLAAKEIKDYKNVFVGIGIPMIAGFLAIHTHASHSSLVFEGGYTGREQPFACTDVGDSVLGYKSPYITSTWRIFSDLQRGLFDLAIIGAAQVDKYGNVNSTALFGNKNYQQPSVRLPGSGGANDMASSAKKLLIASRLEKRRFVDRVDYLTSPGHINGPFARKKAGLKGDGPTAVITDKCVFRFDRITKQMYLESIFPDSTVSEICRDVEFDLQVAPKVRTIKPPKMEDIAFMRNFDPLDMILRRRPLFGKASFSNWYDLTKKALKGKSSPL